MEDESTIQMDTNYVLEKIQNIKKENASLRERLEKMQTAYLNLEKIKMWKEKKLEYVFVTPLSHLKAKRRMSAFQNSLRKKKCYHIKKNSCQSVLQSSCYESSVENNLIARERIDNVAGEKNHVSHSTSEDSCFRNISDDKNSKDNNFHQNHSNENHSLESLNIGNMNNNKNFISNDSIFMPPNKENAQNNIPSEEEGSSINFNSANFLKVLNSSEKNENAASIPFPENASSLNFDNESFLKVLNSDDEDTNDPSNPSNENLSSKDSHVKNMNNNKTYSSNGLTFVSPKDKSAQSTPKKNESYINFDNESFLKVLNSDEEDDNDPSFPSNENLLSKDSCSKTVNDNKKFFSNDETFMSPNHENVQSSLSKNDESSVNFNRKNFLMMKSSNEKDNHILYFPSKENTSAIISNEETLKNKHSKISCKRQMETTVKAPTRKSPRIFLSKNASFLPVIPKESTKLDTPLNKSNPDPSLGSDVSLKHNVNCGLKKMLAENSLSDSEEDILLPDLDESIFVGMPENSNDVAEKTEQKKKKPNPKLFQKYVRKMGDLVPKPVEKSLKSLEKTDITPQNIYNVSQSLAQLLIAETDILGCENSSFKMRLILFFILKYLTVTYHKPIFDFLKTQDASILLPRTELCIVSVLHKIESDSYKGLLSSFVFTIHQLVLAMPALPIFGCCAMCRILTKIYKLKQNSRGPIDLCCEILKMKHKFTTMLIASVVGVWPELFLIPVDAPGEEATFYQTISYYSKIWPEAVPSTKYKTCLTQQEWLKSKELLDKFLPSPSTFNSKDTVDLLIKRIIKKCLHGSYSKEYMLTYPLVIIAVCQEWYWAKENVINKYLVPYIRKFVDSHKNERALTLFCRLYAEICSRYPDRYHPEEFLFKIFHSGIKNEDDKYMQDAAAGAIIQLLLSRDKPLDGDIKKWYEQNKNNPKFSYLESIFFRSEIKNNDEFTEEHMRLNQDLFS